jgi:hypothetical protein
VNGLFHRAPSGLGSTIPSSGGVVSTHPAGFNPASQPPAIGARRGGWSAAVAIALAFAAAYSINHFTPPDLNVFPLYLIPIGLTLFNFGFTWATLACLLAALLGFQAELVAASTFGRTYSFPWIPLQVWAVRGLVYLLITWLLTLHTRSRQIARHRLDTLKGLLPLCPDCGMLLCHDGQWRSAEAIDADPGSLPPLPEHGCQPSHPPAAPEAWR